MSVGGMALKMVALPLRRRFIGALLMVAGVAVVAVGFMLDLTELDLRSLRVSGLVTDPGGVRGLGGGTTAASTLRHVADHGLSSGTSVLAVGDVALRLGVVVMAAAAVACLVAAALPPLRGIGGVLAGVGLVGDAAVAGVVVGQHTRLSALPGITSQVAVGSGVVVIAIGFGVVVVGAGLAALRPLAGVAGAVALAVAGAALGTVLALLVGGENVVLGRPA